MGSSHAPGVVFLLIIQFDKPEFVFIVQYFSQE